MPEVVQTLDEATNTLVNPSGLNLTDPDDSRAYADQVWQAGVLLNVAIDEPQHLTSEGVKSIEPCDVFPVAQRALEEVLLQLPLVNDPVGSVIWCAGRLAQELPPAAQLAQVDGLRLAEWLLGVLESPYAEQVDIDPVQYAEALGPEGLKELRERAQGEYVGRRLAVLSGSVEEVFRTHTDGYEQLISGLSEIGRFDLAYTYSEEAMRILPAEETFNIAGGWAAITDVHFPHRSPYVNERVFDAFPTLSRAKGLLRRWGIAQWSTSRLGCAISPGILQCFSISAYAIRNEHGRQPRTPGSNAMWQNDFFRTCRTRPFPFLCSLLRRSWKQKMPMVATKRMGCSGKFRKQLSRLYLRTS